MATVEPSDAPARRRSSSLFRRVSARAVGMERDSLCHKSHWVPKSSRSACANCKLTFGVFSAKHNCRLCGEVVCGACSTKRILFQKKSVRSCDECVNHSVETISRFNRSSSSSADLLSSSDEAAPKQVRFAKPRAHAKRNSDSDVMPTANAPPTRQRGQSQPAVPTSKELHAYRPVPRVESWRLQLPYMIVFFLMTVAGITNVLSLV